MKKSFNLSLNSRTLEREMPKFKGVRLNLIMCPFAFGSQINKFAPSEVIQNANR